MCCIPAAAAAADCAAGLYLNGTQADATSTCLPCPSGQFCVGGNGRTNANSEASNCPDGLLTRFTGAKSSAQCFTVAGYGRRSVRGANGVITYSAAPCPVGTYNVGGNTAACQKCGNGLTTNSTQSTSADACVAPAGSYLDKGTGKKCPKGTYTTDLNRAGVCTPCNEGVTTAAEGSTSAAACDRAIAGYFYNGTGTAEVCPINTYNAGETTADSCTACPNGERGRHLIGAGVPCTRALQHPAAVMPSSR